MSGVDPSIVVDVQRPSSRPSLERLPALDGLRALAMYLVVLFHAGVDRFAGGFIGVDVFFVLSGFLITRLLLVEQAEHGRIDLVRFAGRRIRRLLPAASLTVIATCVVFVAFSSPIERQAVLRDAQASVFYVANWNFIDRGQDYFGGSLDSSPFLHLWSLAVEEQFYVVWPIAMMVVARWWTRSSRAAGRTTAAVGALAVLGAAYALAVADGDPIRAYYGTDTRAYQLLAGAAIAFALMRHDGATRRHLDARLGDLGVAQVWRASSRSRSSAASAPWPGAWPPPSPPWWRSPRWRRRVESRGRPERSARRRSPVSATSRTAPTSGTGRS